jgi:hypothetical protein
MKKYLSYLENKSTIIRDRRINVKNLWLKNKKIFDEDEAINFIKNNCKEFLEYPVFITRSLNEVEEQFFYSKPIERHSLDNLNFYNLIMDNSLIWNGYPKRLKSFCCVLYGKSNLGYTTYFVIPLDNSKWGLCQGMDIFVSFKNMLSKTGWYINDFFDFLYDFVDDKLGIELNDNNYNIFKEQIDTVEIMLDENPTLKNKFLQRFCSYRCMDPIVERIDAIGLFNTIEELMEPKINNFEICTLKDMYNNDYIKNDLVTKIKNECWTESPCIFIKYDTNSENFFKKIGLKLKNANLNVNCMYFE